MFFPATLVTLLHVHWQDFGVKITIFKKYLACAIHCKLSLKFCVIISFNMGLKDKDLVGIMMEMDMIFEGCSQSCSK